MTVLLVLFTLILFLVLDHVVQRKQTKIALARQTVGAKTRFLFPFHIPDGVSLALNHTWMRSNEDGTVTVGVDGFLSRLLGQVETVVLPFPGEVVAPTLPGIALGIQNKVLQVAPPVTGRIVEMNREVVNDPRCLLNDPYGKGWLFRVRSEGRDIASGRKHTVAHPGEWMKEQASLVRDFLAMNLRQAQPVILQEGGVPVAGILQRCESDAWKEFGSSFVSLNRKEKTGNREEPS